MREEPAFMTGTQFMKFMMGEELPIDEERKKKDIEQFKKDYPHAIIKISKYDMTASARYKNGKYHCIKCGKPMNNRCNMKLEKGKWVPKKKKDNISNQECPEHYPSGGAPIMVGLSFLGTVTRRSDCDD
jgi:hypothetical protein